MSQSRSLTIENVLFERMGITVEDALAVGADMIDEKVAAASRSGIDVEQRLGNLSGLLERLTRPETTEAVGRLIDCLPELAGLLEKTAAWPNVVSTMVDVMDDYQERFSRDGIDVEQAMANGVRAALWLGSQIRNEDLNRIGELLHSHILDARSVRVVDNAAQSLAIAEEELTGPAADARVGLLGLLAALRKPEIQRSLAFGIRFAQSFGQHLEQDGNKNRK